MSKELPADLSAFVERKVASGSYRDRDEVVHEALRLMADMESADRRFETAVRDSRAAIDRGDYTDCTAEEIEQVLEEIFEETCA